MPEPSASFAGATYLDRSRRIEEVRAAARRAAEHLPSIRRILLFGSLQAGDATPRSDADILVVLEDSADADPRSYVPEILGAMAPLPCPLDLFVVTVGGLERARRENAPLARVALATGIDLL